MKHRNLISIPNHKRYYYISINADKCSLNLAPSFSILSSVSLDLGDPDSISNNYFIFGNEIRYTPPKYEIIKLTSNNLNILEPFSDEISEFESFDLIRDIVLNGRRDLYLYMDGDEVISYANFGHCGTYEGKDIYEIGIFTFEKYRNKGNAAEMLNGIIHAEYPQSYILYNADEDNIASVRVAEKLGMRYLKKSYYYANY